MAPTEAGSAFVADRAEQAREILCLQEERRVGNDNTVKWGGRSLQIPPSRLRPHFVRAMVRVHEYPDGCLAIFHGPHRLADYDAQGNLGDDTRLAASAASAAGLWICGQRRALPTTPQPPQPQKRSIDALQKPVNLTRQLQAGRWKALIEPHMPAVKPLGRPRATDSRAALHGILYIARWLAVNRP